MNIQTQPTLAQDPGTSDPDTLPQGVQPTSGLRSHVMGALQIAAVILAVGAAILFSRADEGGRRFVGAAANSAATAPLVQTIAPRAVSRRVRVEATGSVAVRSMVELTPEVTGRVAQLSENLRAGGRFAAGEELLRIDPRDFQLAVAQARAEFDSAVASLELVRAESAAAVRNYALLNGAARVPPLVAKTPQIAQGQAQLTGARARLDAALLNLARTRFTLPFAGRVNSASAEVGQVLRPGQTFGRAWALDALEVVVPVSADQLQQLAPAVGRRAEVAGGGIRATATVERQSAELDEQTRFARLYLRLRDADVLLPGTFLEVTLLGEELPAAFELPLAVEQDGGRLWVVRNGVLAAVEPTVRYRTSVSLVVDVFDTGEGVVVGAVPGARAGLPVRIPERQPADTAAVGMSGA